MSSGIFNPQNRFWQTLDHFADLLILSLLWLVCSLPLVTAGGGRGAPPPPRGARAGGAGAPPRIPPADPLAYGNPCRARRPITEADKVLGE